MFNYLSIITISLSILPNILLALSIHDDDHFGLSNSGFHDNFGFHDFHNDISKTTKAISKGSGQQKIMVEKTIDGFKDVVETDETQKEVTKNDHTDTTKNLNTDLDAHEEQTKYQDKSKITTKKLLLKPKLLDLEHSENLEHFDKIPHGFQVADGFIHIEGNDIDTSTKYLTASKKSIGTETFDHTSSSDNKFNNNNFKDTTLDTTTSIDGIDILSKVNELNDLKKIKKSFRSNQDSKFPKLFDHKW